MQKDPKFNSLTPEQLFFKYVPVTNAMPMSRLQQSNSPSLAAPAANIVSRIFSLAPCTSFLPHTHPGASEFFVGDIGTVTFRTILNGALVDRVVTPGSTILVPQGAIHYFWNTGCTQVPPPPPGPPARSLRTHAHL